MEGRCLDPGGQRLGVVGERQHRLLGVHEGPEAGSFEFLCHRRQPPPPSSCKSLATDNRGLGGLATGQVQPLSSQPIREPRPSVGVPRPFQAKHTGLGSTPLCGAWLGCRPSPSHRGRAPGHSPQAVPSPAAGRVPVGKWPPRHGFRREGGLQEGPPLPQAACAPPNGQLWEHPEHPCARSP